MATRSNKERGAERPLVPTDPHRTAGYVPEISDPDIPFRISICLERITSDETIHRPENPDTDHTIQPKNNIPFLLKNEIQ